MRLDLPMRAARRLLPVATLGLAGLWTAPVVAQVAYPGSEKAEFDSTEPATGSQVPIFGWWLKADQGGKRPAVIALHGCGGLYSTLPQKQGQLTARHAAMAELLHDAGYHVFFPDSFTPRGKRSICGEKIGSRTLTSAHRRADVEGALQWLAQRPEVDATRIALLGWSHGGSAVLASVNATRAGTPAQVAVTRTVQPKAAVAFYPGCSPYAKQHPSYRSSAPLLILMGEKDDWTPAAPCSALARQSGKGMPITLRIYPDSYHDFDAPGLPLRVRRDVPNGVHPGAGVTTGSNLAARKAAYEEMLEFLAAQLD